jgi:hypothetical protein
MASPQLMTVAETTVFSRQAADALDREKRDALVDYLSDNPEAGDLIRGSGGVRKLRWAMPGRGKSGGVRVIYYFHGEEMPLWLLTLFAKHEQSNLSDEEVNVLAKPVGTLKDELRRRKERRP